MKSPDKNLLQKALGEIKSIMHEQSVKKLTIQRKYLPEIFDTELLAIYEDLPVIKPYVVNFFRAGGIIVSMSNTEIKFRDFEDVLQRIIESNPEVKAAAIVSPEGLPIESALPKGVDGTRIAAMTAALLSLAERSVIEMKKGEFEQLIIRGRDGYLLVLQAGPNTLLTLSTTKNARLGLILLEYNRNFKNLSEDEEAVKE